MVPVVVVPLFVSVKMICNGPKFIDIVFSFWNCLFTHAEAAPLRPAQTRLSVTGRRSPQPPFSRAAPVFPENLPPLRPAPGLSLLPHRLPPGHPAAPVPTRAQTRAKAAPSPDSDRSEE